MKNNIYLTMTGLFVFGVYLYTVNPSVAAYRDSGEMVVMAKTLGVPHPPGYPFYALSAKLAASIPLGNISYRLNVFSSACVAMAVVLTVLLLSTFVPSGIAAAMGLVWASAPTVWSVGVVSEMYGLGLVFLAAVFLLARQAEEKSVWLLALLLGLGLGNRMELSLVVPGLLVFLWFKGGYRLNQTTVLAACFFCARIFGIFVFAFSC